MVRLMSDPPAAREWDRMLLSAPVPSLLQTHGWGEVQAGAGWRVHRLLVELGSGQLPVTALVGPRGFPGATRVYVPRGPACLPADGEAFAAVTRSLVQLGRRQRALAIEVEPPWPAEEVPVGHPLRAWATIPARQPLASVVVDLRPPPEVILASFHPKTRYNVRLAERRGTAVRQGSAEELSQCLRATEGRQGINLPSRQHLELVLENLGRSAAVMVAEVEGEVAAGILVARCGGELVYLYGGGTGRHREAMPSYLLHWRAMIEAREEGCTDYDLWGIPEDDRPDHPWHGLAQFKRGFNGRRVRYLGCRRLPLVPGGGGVLTAAERARRLARRWSRG